MKIDALDIFYEIINLLIFPGIVSLVLWNLEQEVLFKKHADSCVAGINGVSQSTYLLISLFVRLYGYIECVQKFFSGSRLVNQRIIRNKPISF